MLMRFDKNLKYVVFDTETESLNLHFSRPWQISYLVCEGDRVMEEVDDYITQDNLELSKGAAFVTKFSWDKYNRRKIDSQVAWDKFARYLFDEDYILVGHNILGFDAYQIGSWMRELGIENDWSFINRFVDSNCLAKAIAMEEKFPKGDATARTLWQYKFANTRIKTKTNLSFTAKNYGIDIDPNKMHDALEDVRVNRKVFMKQIYEIEI